MLALGPVDGDWQQLGYGPCDSETPPPDDMVELVDFFISLRGCCPSALLRSYVTFAERPFPPKPSAKIPVSEIDPFLPLAILAQAERRLSAVVG